MKAGKVLVYPHEFRYSLTDTKSPMKMNCPDYPKLPGANGETHAVETMNPVCRFLLLTPMDGAINDGRFLYWLSNHYKIYWVLKRPLG